MRVSIIAIGSRGDVEPHLALAIGLKEAGHEVTVCTHPEFESFVKSRSIGYRALSVEVKPILEGNSGHKWVEEGQNPARTLYEMVQFAKPLVNDLMRECLDCARDSEAIIYSTLAAIAGSTAAEYLKIPGISSHLQPPTRMQPLLGGPTRNREAFVGLLEWLVVVMSENIIWSQLKSPLKRWRLELGLKPNVNPFLTSGLDPSGRPSLYAYSQSVVPRPFDWPDYVHQTGYWFLPPETSWTPPIELEEFLGAGPPPVFISFGSMTSSDPKGITETIIEALTSVGCRGIIGAGWAGLGAEKLPKDIICIGAVPYGWLFPKMAAVVHHGGAGTTSTVMRAGVPSVVIPCLLDQFFWAKRVVAMGLGPKPVQRKNLNAKHLADSIREAITTPNYLENAKRIGKQLAFEDGVGKAVVEINRYLDAKSI
ncbi:MAG: glycosyltransferase family 1 protein [Acidimicrobiales bacterium]|nr:glycosyltransferase family 1 protein [Acidimicrobiales bacterium]